MNQDHQALEAFISDCNTVGVAQAKEMALERINVAKKGRWGKSCKHFLVQVLPGITFLSATCGGIMYLVGLVMGYSSPIQLSVFIGLLAFVFLAQTTFAMVLSGYTPANLAKLPELIEQWSLPLVSQRKCMVFEQMLSRNPGLNLEPIGRPPVVGDFALGAFRIAAEWERKATSDEEQEEFAAWHRICLRAGVETPAVSSI